MTYASHTRRPNPAALAGALGIPAAVGALLIVGLAVNIAVAPTQPRIKGVTFTPTPLPPPPPPTPTPDQPTNPATPQAPTSTTQTRADMLPVDLGTSNPVFALPGTGDLAGPIIDSRDMTVPPFTPTPMPPPLKSVGAAPRGNPGNWVTDGDYRPRWIREDMAGTARFTLSIDARGKVSGCTITRSTGHAALDEATCDRVTRRARFDAARDSTGKPVTGSYSGTITWKIPE